MRWRTAVVLGIEVTFGTTTRLRTFSADMSVTLLELQWVKP